MPNAILACDTGTSVHWLSRHVKIRDGMLFAHSGNLASMGAAMPYAIAAKFAFPGRPVLAFVGDGAMQMNGLNELITVARYWKRWADPRFLVLVVNNRDLSMVSWEQRVLSGAPKFSESQDLPAFSYAAYAEQLGLKGITLSEPAAVSRVWEEALVSDRPVVVDAIVDPNVPPLPPHVTLKQARNYLSAILKGDPDALRIVRASVREIFA